MARIIGTRRAEELGGTGGDDIIRGDGGNDILCGGCGNDSLYGDADNDTLYGGDDDDMLYGGTGSDTLYGGDDCDLLVGGSGNDIMDGGCGYDDFLFNGVTLATNGSDTINCFNECQDQMFFDLRAVNNAIANTGDVLSTGEICSSNIYFGSSANDDDDYFIYDESTGNLYFDKDADDAGVQVLLVTLTGGPCIDTDNIYLV